MSPVLLPVTCLHSMMVHKLTVACHVRRQSGWIWWNNLTVCFVNSTFGYVSPALRLNGTAIVSNCREFCCQCHHWRTVNYMRHRSVTASRHRLYASWLVDDEQRHVVMISRWRVYSNSKLICHELLEFWKHIIDILVIKTHISWHICWWYLCW